MAKPEGLTYTDIAEHQKISLRTVEMDMSWAYTQKNRCQNRYNSVFTIWNVF